MKGKYVFFYTLLLIFLVLSETIPVKATDNTFPKGHPGKHSRKLLKPAQEINGHGTQITFNGIDKWYTDWSPDGKWIAYEQDGDIFVISSEGGEPFNLTISVEGYCYLPCFTHNSYAVTFTNHDSVNDVYTLEVINLLREGYKIIGENALSGYWSHNGRYLVYRTYLTSELALYDNESGSTKIIAGGDWEYGSSCFSPDDRYVITSMIAQDNMLKLFRIPVEGGEPEQLTFHEGNHFDPDFSPDGRWILYTDYLALTLFALNTETWEPFPVFTDIGNYVGRFSPEGSKICYLRDVDGVNEVFVADFPFAKPPQVFLELLTPNGGELLTPGKPFTIEWTSSGVSTVYIEYTSDGGSTWNRIADNVDATTGSYQWFITDIPESQQCWVRISNMVAANLIEDWSDGYFTIVFPAFKPHIHVLSPSGGEEWQAGTIQAISWESEGVSELTIEYSVDGGISYIPIETIVIEDTSLQTHAFEWLVHGKPSQECLVSIYSETDEEVYGESEDFFAIISAEEEPYIVLKSPTGGEEWEIGSEQQIIWESNAVETVTIEYSKDGGTIWDVIVSNYTPSITDNVSLQGSYSWIIPETPSNSCVVKVSDASNPDLFAISINPFSIIRTGVKEPELVFKYQTNDLITFSSPAIGKDGTVYIGSNDYNLYAINPYGNIKWNRDLGVIWSSPAVTGDGTIYIGTLDGILYALDSNGNHKWNYTVDSAIFSSPAIANDGTIYFGSGEMFYAINADGSLKWEKNIGVIIYSSPAIGIDGTIYFGDEDGSLYAYNPDGLQRWFARLGDYIFSSPAIGEDGTIYIGTSKYSVIDGVDRGFLYAVNPDGNVKWFSQPIGTYVESSPAIGQDGTIYVGSVGDGYLYALNPENGSIIWNYYTDNIYSSPAIGSDGTIYVGSDDGKLYAININGELIWTYQTFDSIWSSPTITENGIIYVGSYDGNLYAVNSMTNADLADSPWPKFRHDRRNSGRVFTEAKAYVVVTSPDGGEKLVPETEYTITWSFNEVSTVRIEYSVDNGQNWSVISGEAPASSGSFTWSIPQGIDSSDCLVMITDTANTAVSDRSNSPFSISPEPYLEITSRIGGEKLGLGSSLTLQWNHHDVSLVTIKYSTDGGSTWKLIKENVNASDGSFTWMIPEDFSDNCKIMIADVSNPDIADESLGTFSIAANEFITVTSPKFGDRWTAQSTKEITWAFNGITNVKIELSVDNGTTWQTITASTSAASGSYSWAVPDIQKNQCIIKITDTVDKDIYDTSDRFEIIKPELTINHTPIIEAHENDEITFNVVVTSQDSIKSVTLHYDVTGERNFLDLNNTKSMTTVDGSNYSVILDVGVFTALGMEYFIQAKDINNRKTRAPADVGFYSISAQVSDIKSTEQTKGGSAQNAYRMISIPLEIDPSLKTTEYQLSGKLPSGESGTDWRLFRFPAGSSTPDEYPDIESFSPGKAFWLITKNDFRLEAPQGTTVTTSEPFNITLKAGWNDIANPWMFDISWEDIENPSGADLSALYTYNGSWSDPTTPPKKIEPWKGYAVNNLTNMNVIIKLNPKPASNAGKTMVKNEQIMWMLTVNAFAGEAEDTANHFGLRDGAMEAWDRYDHIEPPSIGEYVSVAFPHYEWEQYPYTYTVDFRPPSSPTRSGKNLSWDFDVTTNISHEKITIELDGIENLPEGYDYEVIDRDSDQKIKVDNEAFSFISGSVITEHHFTIEVGNSITRDIEQYSARPGKFVTVICYPNPFNPSTTIQYELSQPGHVVISIFNSLGQRVQRYDIGHKEQGIHNFVFDASGMISGLYFYRVDSGYASATDKMLFMK